MKTLLAPSPAVALPSLHRTRLFKPVSTLSFTPTKPNSLPTPLVQFKKPKFKNFVAISDPPASTEPETETHDQDEQFDWFANWYALMPVVDLDKKAPRGMKVMGLEVVVWWDKNENEWKVFDDRCPHRLAPLSEGRIDQNGQLQCVYHGWCFSGSGDCKLIPQAPSSGPPVHTNKRACATVYPSVVQNGIVWFWPNTDPQYKNILEKKKPPYFAELEDPSYSSQLFTRDIAYGYEVLIENLMDPAHVPYSHAGVMESAHSVMPDRDRDLEGGKPIQIHVEKMDKTGFTAQQQNGKWKFVAPCLFYGKWNPFESGDDSTKGKLAEKTTPQLAFIFICVPVSPGYSRMIFAAPKNFDVWIDRIIPRWFTHINQNLVADSDLYLLHVEEKKLMEGDWQKNCFVPTQSDGHVIAFRKWLKKYSGGHMKWGNNVDGSIPPTPPKEQLMDRYWTHVVNCSSCSVAYKNLNRLEVFLQVFSVASVAIVAATKDGMISVAARNTLVLAAILCFAGSKWLSHFIYKNYHFHDYNHTSDRS